MKTVTVTGAKRLGISRCLATATMAEVTARMTDEDISCLVVVDSQGLLEGIISRTDVLRAALADDNWRQTPCRQWMTTAVVTVDPDTLLHDAAELMQQHQVHRIVVAKAEGERQRPVAVLSSGDVVYHLHRRALQLSSSQEA
ncbi:MAG: CBS domain-containing protein [Caldilineales bacterium]|nr:CBS domain-containing protein [Caldilineales bacterium]MCW5858382.1 CBS domain-containing protein [Caldilineales bacterium]